MDSELSFLDFARGGRSALWPLDFVVQVTFDSPTYLAEKGAPDSPPFEFSREWVDQAVVGGLDSTLGQQLEARRVLNDFREFTVLQRFFRLAFTGAFGNQFPLAALVQLATIHPQQPPEPVKTPRWNADPQRDSELRRAGLGAALDALGISNDEGFLQQTDRCPVIYP